MAMSAVGWRPSRARRPGAHLRRGTREAVATTGVGRCGGGVLGVDTRKKRGAAVFNEEEEEGIDLRQALALIYQED